MPRPALPTQTSIERPIAQLVDVAAPGDVGDHGQGVAPEPRGDGGQLGAPARGEHDALGTPRGDELGEVLADARRCPGDDDDLVLHGDILGSDPVQIPGKAIGLPRDILI